MGRTFRANGAIGLALAGVLLVGCPSAEHPAAADTLEGQAVFPTYRTQADISEVATAATVSLIDPVLNQTRATTLTDAQGRFKLNFGPKEIEQDRFYYLEAVKGLGSNAVGRDAVRVRTLAQRQKAGWVSLTNALPDGFLRIDASSTALCVMVSLLQDTRPATPSLLIGTLAATGAGSATFASEGTGLSQEDFTSVRALVTAAIGNDRDPFDVVRLAPGDAYVLKDGGLSAPGAPTIAQVSPSVALPGETILLRGSGFGSTPDRNEVVFAPGIPATVTAVTPDALRVVVPEGASTGELRLTVDAQTATASFTLLPAVAGDLSP